MTQLTLEKAKDLLKKLQYAKAQMGQLSLNDEMYKQALEIAIPMLGQQHRFNDDWIVWPGGNCPIDKNKVVYVKFRDGDTDNNGAKAGTMDWFHFGESWDIIAYRLVKP